MSYLKNEQESLSLTLPDTVPERSGYGDVFSILVIILCIALGLQAYTGLTKYAALRSHGVIAEGRWADRRQNLCNLLFYRRLQNLSQ